MHEEFPHDQGNGVEYPKNPPPFKSWGLTSFVLYTPVSLAALAWIAWRGGKEAVFSRLLGNHPLQDILLGVAATMVILGTWGAIRPYFAWVQIFEDAVAGMVGKISLSACFVVALTSGFAEELVFRAALQPEIGIFFTTLIFSLLHLPFNRDLRPWPVFAFLVGLLLGFCYKHTGAMLAPFTTHFLINLINLFKISRKTRNMTKSNDIPDID